MSFNLDSSLSLFWDLNIGAGPTENLLYVAVFFFVFFLVLDFVFGFVFVFVFRFEPGSRAY